MTEQVDGAHVRMVADSHRTVWDTTFTVAARPDYTTSMNSTLR